ncbi:DUF4382 domain-containing protein [Sediminibacterium sp.]|uniref:DUF4382 domain-containing protein n=1 Tax=Sediminibacterium sp. TaxID=1917865 RepID=UPI003F708D8B
MKKTTPFKLIALLAISVSIVFTACNKTSSVETPVGMQSVSVLLTDAPGVFDNVFIDIKSVSLLIDTSKDTRRKDTCDWDRIGSSRHAKNDSSLVWQDLGVKAGVYDILKLRNGVDTLLATSTVYKGAIRLIKIELGTSHSLIKDSVSYPLNIPSNEKPYVLIKLKGNEWDEYLPNKSRLWLDFDISRSIVEKNNQFYLKPYIKFFTVKSTAGISGKVTPKEAQAVITVFNNTDTAYALPNHEGFFKIRGLKDGNYAVFVNASNGYADTTIRNVVVSKTKEAQLGLITLKK